MDVKTVKGTGQYPPDWKQLSAMVKAANGNKCERCQHLHDPKHGYTLTVHHLDGNKANSEHWNLACLCQRCHLVIQGKVFLPQFYLFEHSDWFKPHIVGYYTSLGLTWKEATPV